MSSARKGPRVVARTAAAVATVAAILPLGACSDGEPARRSAVLITLDTTNPGALDFYGKSRGVTPALERFAREAVVYDRARTVAPLTLPAHASMLTGLYPPRHTVRDNGHLPLPASADTVAERAREAGYRTAAFVGAAVLAPAYGLSQGFEVYEAPEGEAKHGGSYVQRPGPEVTRAAVDWLDGRRDGEPFFLWAHYFDAHMPNDPAPEYLRQAGGNSYLADVALMDRAVGDLLDRLRAEPDYDEMIVVVVADHGEALGRHGEPTHALLVYDATIQVPMLVRLPGGRRAGERSEVVASVIDVFPTLLEGMGLAPPRRVDGLSLIADEVPAGRGVYFESYCGFLNFGWSPLSGWADASGQYLHGARPELYGAGDPRQENDVFDPGDERVLRAREAIAAVAQGGALPRGEDDAAALAAQADVRALGYAGVASPEAEIPHPLAPTDLPAPTARLKEYYVVIDAPQLVAAGRRDDAIRNLREVVEQNPRNAFALDALGQYLIEAGRPREALEPLGELLVLGLDRPVLRHHLASAHEALGDYPAALEHLDVAERLLPGDPDVAEARERIEATIARGEAPGD